MTKHFTHLHLHTEYSLLDGAITLPKLIDHAKAQGLKSLAITDHGNIFGAVKFFQLCKKAGIKPILGMEAYITENVDQRSVDKKYYHLILLVENEIGYKNLCKLIAYSYQKGFYFKPRIDYNILQQHCQGLIATSACLGGHIPQLLKNDQEEQALQQIDWFVKHFGKDRFYFEVQPEDQEEQKVMNKKLFELGAKLGIDCVATTDCHYLSLQDHQAHEVMLAIGTGKRFDDPTRFSFGQCRAYMRSEAEMLEIFKDHPQAVYNTGKIADMCNFEFETGKLFFPAFATPQDQTPEQYFQTLCRAGLETLANNKRFPAEHKEKYVARLELEMDLIIKMGFVGYFLIVSDFIMWSRRNNIPVGPGRGSAAGALVAWCLEITNIDPLKYNLLFERFLNPERVSMPDIDIDFCIEGRETVINYIKDKYGHDKVCQIITFGTMLAKGVIKDVARALGLPFEESNMITALVPEQLKITLKEALEQEPQLKELTENNPTIKHVFDIAFKLEGVTRHASKHAAGIVITPEPTHEMLPIFIPPKDNAIVAQYAMTELESIGFLKIDLLGLKNLTLVKNTLNSIKHHQNITIDIDHIPLDDQKTFDLLQAGKTSGVFQLESDGLKDVLRKLKPDKFEDIIAVNALYRPGPLNAGMVDDYILRRHGKQTIEYFFDELKDVLEETYGVIVYQEQVMKIASVIGGYSLGEADILRRAMGKKKADVMAEQKKLFVDRAVAKGFDLKKSDALFELMAYFAGYGFNKSHSAAYALIAYQTAYLKANYPAQFAACLISLEATNAEKMAFYLKEARDMGIELLPPNINKSHIDFTVVDNKILFGLQGIKNIGLASLHNIIADREKKGPFKDILDFCQRIDLRTSNKRVLENLICAGAFDELPGNRAQKFYELAHIIELALEIKEHKLTGQMQLFSTGKSTTDHEQAYSFSSRPEWSNKEKLEKEKEVLGFYISSHPIQVNEKQLTWIQAHTIASLLELVKKHPAHVSQEPTIITYGLLTQKKIISTKKGERMAFVQIEDLHNHAEIIVFPRLFKQIESWLSDYTIFIVKGALDISAQANCKIKANQCVPLELVFDQWDKINQVTLQLPDDVTLEHIDFIKKIEGGKIPLRMIFQENGKNIKLVTKKSVSLNLDLIAKLHELNISGTVDL
ncbi:MAG TPA: DNA polymerase III subunit alpha [Candidatus Saccharimonadales bacterium]|nr:DNA polymerase III subunit alpha [Candidatus Saccharimonadales bacterium]